MHVFIYENSLGRVTHNFNEHGPSYCHGANTWQLSLNDRVRIVLNCRFSREVVLSVSKAALNAVLTRNKRFYDTSLLFVHYFLFKGKRAW